MAAAVLAEIGARDPHPPVLGGVGQHAPQQLAVANLGAGLLAEGEVRLADPHGERVAHPLQLGEAGHPRRAGRRADAGLDLEAGKGLGGEPRELALEAADLAAQLGAGEALVAPRAQRSRRVQCK